MNNFFEIVLRYYSALSSKNLEDPIAFYAENVVLKSPLGVVLGNSDASNSLRGFSNIVLNISIKYSFVLQNKVALGLDFSCESPFGDFFAIVVMEFNDNNQIISSELFYDETLFRKEKFDV